jgi:hypothetical protein
MQYVQFADTDQKSITSVFGCAQDEVDHPNQGKVEDNDPRYLAFLETLTE